MTLVTLGNDIWWPWPLLVKRCWLPWWPWWVMALLTTCGYLVINLHDDNDNPCDNIKTFCLFNDWDQVTTHTTNQVMTRTTNETKWCCGKCLVMTKVTTPDKTFTTHVMTKIWSWQPWWQLWLPIVMSVMNWWWPSNFVNTSDNIWWLKLAILSPKQNSAFLADIRTRWCSQEHALSILFYAIKQSSW